MTYSPPVGPAQSDQFNGHWTLFSAQPYLPGSFSYQITAGIGVCTRTNAPGVFDIGDVIFKVDEAWGERFHAQQMFTDGVWYRCSGILVGDEIQFEGNHWRRVMIRIADQLG